MLYAIVFFVLAGYLAALALGIGGWGYLLLWPAIGFATVAAAYAGIGPRLFGKRPDGRLHPVAVVTLLPFLMFTGMVWHVLRLVAGQPAHHEVAPGLYAGRRVLSSELPPGISLVVDLTAEFSEPLGVRTGRAYLSLPVLDAGLPDDSAFQRAVLIAAASQGPVYVHCAQGHGRTGLFVAAVLLARGLASTPAEAVARIRALRPGVRLKPAQREALNRFASENSPGGKPPSGVLP